MAFTPMVRENVKVSIGLAGGTGGGKTLTGLMLCVGLAEGGKIAGIDSEGGRMTHYADDFKIDREVIEAPYTAQKYLAKIKEAEKAGYAACLVDSLSDAWEGEGGSLDLHDSEMKRLAKGERGSMAAWAVAKAGHRELALKILKPKIHLVICFRAEPKIEMVPDENGKIKIREKKGLIAYHGWCPITEKSIPFKLTSYLMLSAEKPGFPLPIKVERHHRKFYPKDKAMSQDTGKRMAEWAKGSDEPSDAQAANWANATNATKQEPKPAAATKPAESTPKASEECADMLTVIKEASTVEELKNIGRQIKNMSYAARKVLRPYYTSRLGHLKK